jgi:MOSC domain-containing protein YiiM
MTARVVSVNVGQARELRWRGQSVESAFVKEPVAGAVRVLQLGLEGDRQVDLSVHGGPNKAVYLYPSEHYPAWRAELGAELAWGAFGENLTIEGLLEPEVRIGDVLRIGTAELLVTKARRPCFKMQFRFQRADMVKRFARAGRSGFYVAVLREGVLAAGDAIALVPGDAPGPTVAEAFSAEMARASSPDEP